MSWTPYVGDRYLSWHEIAGWCHALAQAHPDLVTLDRIGTTRHGNGLLLLTVATGRDRRRVADRSAFWLDGGTHAAEWAGVMSALYTVSRWVEGLIEGDPSLTDWFSRHAAFVLPCMSPDGYQALHDGAPFLRSTLRPPRPGQLRVGLEPRDIDGDGEVRWMRWRHPAGPYVEDETLPLYMRNRRVDDDPSRAFFVAPEGEFLEWDGHRWIAAPLRHGLDLNRNFPGHWAPFSMFGMDGGDIPLSEPESRAVVDALRARPGVAAAVTNHTYTGALLTQPYRDPSPLSDQDIALMEILGQDAVRGTGYRCLRVHPDFVYDPSKPIVGVWADTLSTVFGIPGYTLELWDPFAAAGFTNDDPATFFRLPTDDQLRPLFAHFTGPGAADDAVRPWRPFQHPQLGPVEIGGIDYLRTVRNPPTALLATECARGHTVADRIRMALPDLTVRIVEKPLPGGLRSIEAIVENLGFLSTGGLPYAEQRNLVPTVQLRLEPHPGARIVAGESAVDLGHIDGWGAMRIAGSRHPLYPNLPARDHRRAVRWVVEGDGPITVHWTGARAGNGATTSVPSMPADPPSGAG